MNRCNYRNTVCVVGKTLNQFLGRGHINFSSIKMEFWPILALHVFSCCSVLLSCPTLHNVLHILMGVRSGLQAGKQVPPKGSKALSFQFCPLHAKISWDSMDEWFYEIMNCRLLYLPTIPSHCMTLPTVFYKEVKFSLRCSFNTQSWQPVTIFYL